MPKSYPKDLVSVVLRMPWSNVYAKNSSANIIITGVPGSGKSYVAIQLADVLCRDSSWNPVFDVRSNLALEPMRFRELVARDDPVGRAIVGDEFGLQAAGRKYATQDNIDMSFTFQIMRYNRRFTILTVPDASMIDKHMRITAHLWIHVEGHDDWHSWGRIYLLDQGVSIERSEIYTKKVRFTSKQGNYYVVQKFFCPPPRKALARVYEDMSTTWKKRKELALLASAKAKKQQDVLANMRPQLEEKGIDFISQLVRDGELIPSQGKTIPARMISRRLARELDIHDASVQAAVKQEVDNLIRSGKLAVGD